LMKVDLFLVPGSFTDQRLAGKTLILIDVLRASTTICQALMAGARAVIPVQEPGEAVEMRTKIGADTTLLGGERKGVKIDGFDLGNSPQEYTESRVKGKTIIMTTSNGTRGYIRTGLSKLIITGAIVNMSAIVDKIAWAGSDLVILCAGSDGDFSIEDTLCGGMIIDKLAVEKNMELELNDAASLAWLLYRSNSSNLAQAMAGGEHGRYLDKIGFGPDVELAARVDSIPVLPVLKEGRIVSANN
jgi:2-phosphosulfolactate phosphatase